MDDFLKGAMLERMILVKMKAMTLEVYNNSPMKGTPFGGMALANAIIEVSDQYKASLTNDKDSLGFSESKIEEIIKNVTRDLRDELLE